MFCQKDIRILTEVAPITWAESRNLTLTASLNYYQSEHECRNSLPHKYSQLVFAFSIVIAAHRTMFTCDRAMNTNKNKTQSGKILFRPSFYN